MSPQPLKPLRERLILRRRLTPKQGAIEAPRRVLTRSSGMVVNTVSALQEAMHEGVLDYPAWFRCRVSTLVDYLYPVCFDQVNPLGVFYEVDKHGCLQAFRHHNMARGHGTARYLGPASTAKLDLPRGVFMYRAFEIVLVPETDGLRVAQFSEAMPHIAKALEVYRERPIEAAHMRLNRQASMEQCP